MPTAPPPPWTRVSDRRTPNETPICSSPMKTPHAISWRTSPVFPVAPNRTSPPHAPQPPTPNTSTAWPAHPPPSPNWPLPSSEARTPAPQHIDATSGPQVAPLAVLTVQTLQCPPQPVTPQRPASGVGVEAQGEPEAQGRRATRVRDENHGTGDEGEQQNAGQFAARTQDKGHGTNRGRRGTAARSQPTEARGGARTPGTAAGEARPGTRTRSAHEAGHEGNRTQQHKVRDTRPGRPAGRPREATRTEHERCT
ncbi:hypothetical protein JJ691_29220 [Kutzneria sp. CA-103260]|nr:hypothetical protein JJ691_29220 [Kutzneria sp. CA-103260]